MPVRPGADCLLIDAEVRATDTGPELAGAGLGIPCAANRPKSPTVVERSLGCWADCVLFRVVMEHGAGRPGGAIGWKRRAFILRATRAGPNTGRFMRALRLCARLAHAHPAAFAPNGPDGMCPPARSRLSTARTSSLLPQRSRCHRIARSAGRVRFGCQRKQLAAAPGLELFGWERKLSGVARVQFARRLADRQEAIVRPPLAVAGPVRRIRTLRPFLAGPLRPAIDPAQQRLPRRLRQ